MQDPLQRFRVEGKRAVVTGGSKGIGAEAAVVLAQAGADVAIVGRDRAGLDETAALIAATGRRGVVIEADMATVDGPQEAARQALAAFGTIDILVNNVGGRRIDVPTETLSTADWQRIIDLNLTSDHTDFGQLTITLTSPSGTRSVLAAAHPCTQDPSNPMPIACGPMLMNGTRFGIARLMGEPADGTWTLSVQDETAGGSGSISSWSITAYGY